MRHLWPLDLARYKAPQFEVEKRRAEPDVQHFHTAAQKKARARKRGK